MSPPLARERRRAYKQQAMWNHLRAFLGAQARVPDDPRKVFASEFERVLRSSPDVKQMERVADAFAFDLTTSAGPRRVFLVVPGDHKGAKLKATVEVPFEAIEDRLTRVPNLHPMRFETTGEFLSAQELPQLVRS